MTSLRQVYDAILSSPSSLRFASESEWQAMECQLARSSPGLLALTTSRGKWQPAKHLVHLDIELVDAIEAARAGEIDGIVVSMPPQHGKSELCSKHLPAWFLGSYPDKRVVVTSYEADFAGSWGRKARDILERFGHLFGVSVSKRSFAAQRWEIEHHDGGMVTAGVGGPITGKGADLLIVDDPIKNDEEARSASHREKQWEWWQSVASTRLRPGGLCVVIQTRWHRDDLTGRILRQAETTGRRWRQIKFPALAEQHDVLGRSPGEALWPEMYPRERLLQLQRTKTSYYWQALYQQDPLAEGGTEWPDSYFGPRIWFEEWPREWLCKTLALDPSKGVDSRHGDFSAFVMLMVGHDGVLYFDAEMARWNTSQITDVALDVYQRFRPDWFGVEVNQFQQLLADQFLQRAAERRMLLPLCTVENYINKQIRIRRLTPYLAQGRARFKGDSPGARLLVEQLRDFPLADHDDGPDAAEVSVRLANQLLSRPVQEPECEYFVTT